MAAPALNNNSGDAELDALLLEMGGGEVPSKVAAPPPPPTAPQFRRLTEFSDFSLDDSEFRLKASFETDQCPAYVQPDSTNNSTNNSNNSNNNNNNNNNNNGNNSCCQHCGHIPALHTMKTKTNCFLAVLFCQTRNLRCIASEDLIDTPGVNIQRFADKMERLLQLDAERAVRHQQLTQMDLMLIQEKITALVERIRKPIPPPNTSSHRHDRLEWRMQVMIHADQLYYRIYYVALTALSSRSHTTTAAATANSTSTAGPQHLHIPPPSVYFHELTWNVSDGIEATRRWMNAHLNEQHRMLLVNTFGLQLVEDTSQQHQQAQDSSSNNNTDMASFSSSQSNPLHWLWQLRFTESVRLLWATGYVADASLESLATATERKEHLQAPFQIHETLATPLIQEWRDAARDFPASLYAYATPSPRALQVIREAMLELEEEVQDVNHNITNTNGGPNNNNNDRPITVVEMGAGTGYWSTVLKGLAGVDVKPYDVAPPGQHSDNDYHGEVVPFCPIPQRDSSLMLPSAECLMLCYPPPGTDMAVSALHAFGGSTVLHVGEWVGLTGDIHFEQVLAETFTCVDHVPLPTWGTDAAYVTIWKRKASLMASTTNNNTTTITTAVVDLDPLEEGSPSISPPETIKASRCAAVGGCIACESHKAVRRCRYARHLQYCCVDCYEAHLTSRTYWMAIQMLDTTEQDLDWDDPRHFSELKAGKHHKKRRKKRRRKS